MILEFSVDKQKLKKCSRMVDVVSDSSDYLELQFHFLSDDWSDLDKYVFFRVDKVNYPYLLDNEDKVTVPAFFLAGDKLFFGCYGVDEGVKRVTTNALRVDLVDSYYDSEEVDIRNFLEVMVDDLNDRIDTKADTVYVDAELDLKADKTYVDAEFIVRDTEIAKKSDKSYVDYELNERDIVINTKADKSYVDTELAGKSDVGHKHSKSDITDFSHNHDERYYTESETDVLLNGKSDVGHNHDERYYTETETTTLLNGKVDKVTGKGLSTHDFTDYYKNFLDGFDGDIEAFLLDHKDEIEALISSDVLSGYYLKSEVDELIDRVENKFFVTSDSSVIQTGEATDLFAKMKVDGFPVPNKTIHFFEVLEPSLTVYANPSVIQTGEDADLYCKFKDADGSLAQNMKVHFFKEEEEELINENIETNNLNNDMEE